MGGEHVGDQRPVQPSHAALEHGKAGAGELGGRGCIQAVEHFTDLDMIAHFEIEGARFTPATGFDVVVLACAHRHVVGDEIGQPSPDGILFVLDGFQFGLGRIELFAQIAHLGLERFDILAGSLGLADRLGTTVTLTL